MNNNDDKERWETFCKLYDKLSSKEEMRELFEEEIKCFSLYLSHVNQDYVYNATFLPQFNDDFWNFLCAFNKKYKIVEKLFDVAEKYYNVTLKIDRYWMMTVDEKGKIKKSTLSGVDYICEKEMMIECSILYNLKRYTFRRNEREDNFKEQLKELNKQIADEANNFEEDSAIYPEETEKFYRSNLYGVNVHLDGKSNYTRLDNLDDSEVYLKCISREMSQAGNDFFRMYSDEENRNLEEKLDVLELRSDIEFIYLPMLDEYSEVRPRALNTRLSLEPEYFCSLIELFYKERNGEKREIELNKSLSDRLYEILFQFKVIPGIDWNGNFDAKRFDYWMKTVKTWSRDNDRYEVAMHTVGSGLSYAELDEDKLPQTAIIEELNRVENEELRRGYYLGIINQRGVHWIDPEGKPELELAEDYENRANTAESRGYSRYAGILRVIGDEFKREARRNALRARNENDDIE